ncbi:MAG: DNA polymerase, partial [bacterium]|nr:DNA polymerase [bacterium]
IQGTQADLIKMAMVRIGEEVLEKSADIRLLLQIHDELLFEVRDWEVDRILPVITNIMTDKSLLLVPIEVHVSRGVNWGEMEKG